MKLKLLALALVILISDSAFSQQSTFQTINLDTSITKTLDSASFYVKNPTTKVMQVTNGRTLNSQFFLRTTSFTVNPSDSVAVWIIFSTKQNITYRDFIIFDNNVLKNSLVFYTVATGKYADVLYAFTQGLVDEPLKTALKNFTTTGYITLGYNVGRDRMYESIDDYGGNDTLECVYTGRRAYVPNRAGANAVSFNCEHTWPQSFFNEADPMVSDVNHLYPTDNNANNVRSNYPFGFVVSGITYNTGGSKLGKDYENATVFEPRDVHKGNVARSLFYFAVKYGNQGGFMSGKMDAALRQWNVSDPVDANEMTRNTRIKQYLNVRNPFIDHPELVDRIKSTFSTIVPLPRPKTASAPVTIKYDTLARNDTTSYYLSIFNYGEGNASINSVSSSNGVFTVESAPTSIAQNSMAYSRIKFRPNANNSTFNGTLTISASDTTIVLNIVGYSNSLSGVTTVSSNVPDKFELSQNFPNPFNPSTKINFAVPYRSFVSLKIFDMNGREVSVLLNQMQNAGTYQYDFNAGNLTSGTYFYKLETADFTQTRKLILVK